MRGHVRCEEKFEILPPLGFLFCENQRCALPQRMYSQAVYAQQSANPLHEGESVIVTKYDLL